MNNIFFFFNNNHINGNCLAKYFDYQPCCSPIVMHQKLTFTRTRQVIELEKENENVPFEDDR